MKIVKNIFIYLIICVAMSFFIAEMQVHFDGYCESMCGFYYFLGFTVLLPALFIFGLSIPLGIAIYPKGDQLVVKKRKRFILFGIAGIIIVLCIYVISSY